MKKLLKYFLSFALIFSVFTPSLLINAKESDETGCPISTAAKNSLNSALGFSVSSSYSVTASYSIKLKKGQKGRIKVRPAYDTYTATIDNYYSGTVGCNFWKKYKDVTVKKYSHPDYSDDVWY